MTDVPEANDDLIRVISPGPLDTEESYVVDLGFGPDDEQTVFDTLEDAEAALGALPVVGPDEDEAEEDIDGEV